MTLFLDIAALAALLLALTFVPLHGLHADRKITRQIHEAERSRAAENDRPAGSVRPPSAHSADHNQPTRRLSAQAAHPAK